MGRWDKRHTFLVATGIINFLVLIFSPALAEPPRLALQKRAVITAVIIACLPLLWFFYLILFGRSRFAKVLAFVNLPLAIAWVVGAVIMIAKAF